MSRKKSFSLIPPAVRLRTEEPASQLEAVVVEVSKTLGISTLTAEVLVRRGIRTPAEAKSFFTPTLRDQLPDPALIRDIGRASSLIVDSCLNNETISIYCDFDVDGVTAGSQLLLFLKECGAQVHIYTPSRFTEGYGLSRVGIERIAALGTKLLITVDCGITNVAEIALAKELGMKVVVVDHHLPQDLPNADAIVDPAQGDCPFESFKLCAAGLVWMLMIVLRVQLRSRGVDENRIPDPKTFLDLAALGTVCDMVPLTGVNRLIAHRGIEALKATTRPGLIALMQVAGVPTNKRLNSGHIGFGIGPRINAAGRLGDAMDAIELLTTTDSIRALSLAKRIDSLNGERQGIEISMKENCQQQLEQFADLAKRPAIALFGKDFHSGVIGIVAQRLVEQYHKPTAVMSPGETTLNGKKIQVIKGSVRSAAGFHVADALKSLSELLISHGGHAEAGGFTLLPENLERFQEAFCASALEFTRDFMRTVTVDVEANFGPIDYRVAEELASLSPFGIGNPSPLILTKNVVVESASLIGESHLRLRLNDGRHSQNAVAWNHQGHPLLRKGELVTVVYSPELNTYQGITSVQLNIREIWQESGPS